MTDAELEAEAKRVAARLLDDEKWVNEAGLVMAATAASLLGRSPRTLANWRSDRGHPLEYRGGARVTYRIIDLLRHIDRGYPMKRDFREAT